MALSQKEGIIHLEYSYSELESMLNILQFSESSQT